MFNKVDKWIIIRTNSKLKEWQLTKDKKKSYRNKYILEREGHSLKDFIFIPLPSLLLKSDQNTTISLLLGLTCKLKGICRGSWRRGWTPLGWWSGPGPCQCTQRASSQSPWTWWTINIKLATIWLLCVPHVRLNFSLDSGKVIRMSREIPRNDEMGF